MPDKLTDDPSGKLPSKNQPPLPERPLECSECKKTIRVKYTEIVGDSITHTSMCADCPELQRRLHGNATLSIVGQTEGTGLACGTCGTSLAAIRVGHPLGCSQCYDVFNDVIFYELLNANKIPARFAENKKTLPMHLGRARGESQELNPTLRLVALNEALDETLKREDYEQAALLRDQIKKLTMNQEQSHEGK